MERPGAGRGWARRLIIEGWDSAQGEPWPGEPRDEQSGVREQGHAFCLQFSYAPSPPPPPCSIMPRLPIFAGVSGECAAVECPLELQGPAALCQACQHQPVPFQVCLRGPWLRFEVGNDVIWNGQGQHMSLAHTQQISYLDLCPPGVYPPRPLSIQTSAHLDLCPSRYLSGCLTTQTSVYLNLYQASIH